MPDLSPRDQLTPREQLAKVLAGTADYLAEAADVLDSLAGWRPPARVITDPDGIAELPTGTVIRSRHGDIGSVDHGSNGEWTGRATIVHFLDFAAVSRLDVAALAEDFMAGSFSWTVLHAPQNGGQA